MIEQIGFTMKKIYGILIALTTTFSAIGQTVETFVDDNFLPEGWTGLNANVNSSFSNTSDGTFSVQLGFGVGNHLTTPELTGVTSFTFYYRHFNGSTFVFDIISSTDDFSSSTTEGTVSTTSSTFTNESATITFGSPFTGKIRIQIATGTTTSGVLLIDDFTYPAMAQVESQITEDFESGSFYWTYSGSFGHVNNASKAYSGSYAEIITGPSTTLTSPEMLNVKKISFQYRTDTPPGNAGFQVYSNIGGQFTQLHAGNITTNSGTYQLYEYEFGSATSGNVQIRCVSSASMVMDDFSVTYSDYSSEGFEANNGDLPVGWNTNELDVRSTNPNSGSNHFQLQRFANATITTPILHDVETFSFYRAVVSEGMGGATYDISTSTDGINFTPIYTSQTFDNQTYEQFPTHDFGSPFTGKIRISIDDASGTDLYLDDFEFQFAETPSAPSADGFTENFDTNTTPTDWTDGGTLSHNPGSGKSRNGSPNAVQLSALGGHITTPELSSINNIQFYYRLDDVGTPSILVKSSTDGIDFSNTLETINVSTTAYTEYFNNEFPEFTGYVRLETPSGNGNNVIIDDFALNVTPPSITVTAPDGGETITIGGSYTITFDATGISNGTELVAYSSNDGFTDNTTFIADGLIESLGGEFSWYVDPANYTAGSNYTIRVETNDGGTVTDDSDATFTLSNGVSANGFSEGFLGLNSTPGDQALSSGTWQGNNVSPSGSTFARGGAGTSVTINNASDSYIETPVLSGVNNLSFWHRRFTSAPSITADVHASADGGVTFNILLGQATSTALTYEQFVHEFNEPYTGPIRITWNTGTTNMFIDDFETNVAVATSAEGYTENFDAGTLPDWNLNDAEFNSANARGGSGNAMLFPFVGATMTTPEISGVTNITFYAKLATAGTADLDIQLSTSGQTTGFQTLETVTISSTDYTQFSVPTTFSGWIRFSSSTGAATSNIVVDDLATNVVVSTDATVTIALPENAKTRTNAATVSWTVTFSEAVEGLSTSNFTLTKGEGNTFSETEGPAFPTENAVTTTDNTVYTVTANTGTGEGTLTLSLANAEGLDKTISTDLPVAGPVITIDKTAPTATLATTIEPVISPLTRLPVTLTFSEAIEGLVVEDFLLVNSTVENLLLDEQADGVVYNLDLLPTTGGLYSAQLLASSYLDIAGNTGLISNKLEKTFDAKVSEADSLVLVAIYNALAGSGWINKTNWLVAGTQVKDWFGVTVVNGQITAIELPGNNLIGELPDDVLALQSLVTLDLSDNEITDIPSFGERELVLNVSSNRLQFGSLEGSASVQGIIYSPQKVVLEEGDVLVQINGSTTIDRTVTGTSNIYVWKTENGEVVDGATGPTLTVENVTFDSEEIYTVEVTSQLVAELTLTTAPFSLKVSSLERDEIALCRIFEALGGQEWTNNEGWCTAPLSGRISGSNQTQPWFGVTVSDSPQRVTGLSLKNNNLVGDMPKDLADLGSLTDLDISDNSITSLPDISRLTNIENVDVKGNKLSFGDFEPNLAILNFQFDVQDRFGTTLDAREQIGTSKTLSLEVSGASNQYQWYYKRRGTPETDVGTPVDGATSRELTIDNLNFDNMGIYYLQVTSSNPAFEDLAVRSRNQNVLAVTDIFGTAFLDPKADTRMTDGDVIVYEIQQPGTPFVPFDTVAVDATTGEYFFNDVVLGDFILRGRPGESITDDVLQTYWESTNDWLQADTLFLREVLTGVNIDMIEIPDPFDPALGDGTIGGFLEIDLPVREEDEESGRTLAARRVRRAGVSLNRARAKQRGNQDEVELELVQYVETTDNGDFGFINVPPGEYFLNIQIPGIPMDPETNIPFVINENGAGESFNIAALATETGIALEVIEETGIAQEYFIDYKLYPNPATNLINLDYERNNAANIKMQILDMMGKEVRYMELHNASRDQLLIDVSDLQNGMYILNFMDSNHNNRIILGARLMISK
ncbi:MAG: T9SS type A sorting domain-containing protein [Cyclobacteriaceae bacterium]